MKKRKKDHQSVFILSFWVVLFTLGLLLFKYSHFSKAIPDVVELPNGVKESIKNLQAQKSLNVPIFLYHYVEYVKDDGDTIRKSLNTVPYLFEQQVKTLKDGGFTFITAKDLADALDDKITLPQKSVILTFDDGYQDFYTDVLPILKKFKVRAVVYIVPNFLDKPNNLSMWQLEEIVQSGLVEIGAHTMDHSYLTGLPIEKVKYEIEQSKRYLEKSLGIKVTSFAYPYGAFDNTIIDMVKKAGFKSAVTIISGNLAQDTNRFFLSRIKPGGKVGQALLDLLEHPTSSNY